MNTRSASSQDTPEAAVGLEKCKWTVNALINHHYKIVSASWQAKTTLPVRW
ncbi:intimin [Salmonella bongori]|nr:intimin [Salmonella bongori]